MSTLGLGRRNALFIDGTEVAPARGEYFTSIDPSSGSGIAEAGRGTAEDIDAAVESSHSAFRSDKWAKMPLADRGRILHRIADRLRENLDDLAMLECLDSGQPLSQARRDIQTAARYFEFYAGLADKIEGSQIPLGSSGFAYTSKEPFGVVGVIVPWNAPLNQAARSVAPALAAGNTCVLKPAEETPLSALRFAQIAAEAGLPDGVVNVVTGFGEEAGQRLVEHPLVRKVSFTGSVETGKIVARVAAERLIPSSLELGGKSPNLVFEDADMDAVVTSVVRTVTHKAGQVCSAATRILVAGEVAHELQEHIGAALGKITIGPGVEDPMLGPLVSENQLNRVLSLIQSGRDEGADVAFGGSRATGPKLDAGYFVQPTVFSNVGAHMTIAREEIFGPVVSMITFQSEDEALEIANDTDYGLAAGVYTRDISRALRVSRALEAGQVFINGYQAGGVETPFGGYKQSGWGREKGTEAINHYTQLKTTIVTI